MARGGSREKEQPRNFSLEFHRNFSRHVRLCFFLPTPSPCRTPPLFSHVLSIHSAAAPFLSLCASTFFRDSSHRSAPSSPTAAPWPERVFGVNGCVSSLSRSDISLNVNFFPRTRPCIAFPGSVDKSIAPVYRSHL